MSWAARTSDLRASRIPAWFRYGTVRDEQTFIEARQHYGVSFALGVSVGMGIEPLDRRPGCAKQ
jgi:hypothetical protein